jgi:hypothetical protein
LPAASRFVRFSKMLNLEMSAHTCLSAIHRGVQLTSQATLAFEVSPGVKKEYRRSFCTVDLLQRQDKRLSTSCSMLNDEDIWMDVGKRRPTKESRIHRQETHSEISKEPRKHKRCSVEKREYKNPRKCENVSAG